MSASTLTLAESAVGQVILFAGQEISVASLAISVASNAIEGSSTASSTPSSSSQATSGSGASTTPTQTGSSNSTFVAPSVGFGAVAASLATIVCGALVGAFITL
ncbi:hypothetical protein BT96DRAFT_1002171 [Gymnopus androsaceus JB14]|uniref:Uncharacterized protein n=1 Tax=Gymnopus androsaceus JB14 TaxID=1447944 RepID=A0A6A4GXS6_9AGAR|nr:hypothetical protein BT96DRAFT_1002171 [Gymnopus androsaceus JB14]